MPVTDYTQWPGPQDALARVEAAGVTLRGGSAEGPRVLQCVQGVTAEIRRRTLRDFMPGAPETRYYDGSGTPELEIDEIVSLAVGADGTTDTAVQVVGSTVYPAYALASVYIVQEQGKPQTRLQVCRGSTTGLVGDGLPSIVQQYLIFPEGRQNIAVTGTFGYGATIPADLWEAAACEMAVRLAAEGLFQQGGQLASFEGGGIKERYQLPDAEATGWHAQFERALGPSPGGYKKPPGRRLRNLRPRMI